MDFWVIKRLMKHPNNYMDPVGPCAEWAGVRRRRCCCGRQTKCSCLVPPNLGSPEVCVNQHRSAQRLSDEKTFLAGNGNPSSKAVASLGVGLGRVIRAPCSCVLEMNQRMFWLELNMCGHLDDYRQQGHNCIVFCWNISPSSCSHSEPQTPRLRGAL